ncbi:MAG: FeoA family protein [bacterium]
MASLDSLKAGQSGKILYMATKHHDRLDKLAALGIIPGTVINVHQTIPAYVIKVDETDIALEKEITKDIFVRQLTN